MVKLPWRSAGGDDPKGEAWPEKPCALWQWEHRTGFKDYDEATCVRIETAYERGEPYVRLKTGKMKQTPMELFFVDMIQHDPITGNQRKIRRTAKPTWCQCMRRKFGELVYSFETGRKYRMDFSQYIDARRELLKDLDHQDYNETDLYSEKGCCTRIARSGAFFLGSMLAVTLNSLWLGVDANFNTANTIWQADAGFQVVEHAFSVVFIAELIIRFGALRRKKDFIKDGWLCFDTILVSIMVGENLVMLPVFLLNQDNANAVSLGDMSILRFLRLLRLTRLSRVARLLRFAPEVMTMLKGITLAVRSVFMTTMLLVVLVYLFGIMFQIQSKSYPDIDLFQTVDEAMWVLILQGTFLDSVSDVVKSLIDASWLLTVLFMIFIFLSNLLLLNMLVGILCEVAFNVSKREKEQAAVGYLKNNLLDILEVHDKNDDRHINKSDFELLMRNPEMRVILSNFGVDAQDLVSLQGILFENRNMVRSSGSKDNLGGLDAPGLEATDSHLYSRDSKRLRFAEFLEVVLRLRGGNGASVRDVVDLREYLRERIDHLAVWLPRAPTRAFNSDSSPFCLPASGNGAPCSPSAESHPDVVGAVLQKVSELRDTLQTMRVQIKRLEESQAAAVEREPSQETPRAEPESR